MPVLINGEQISGGEKRPLVPVFILVVDVDFGKAIGVRNYFESINFAFERVTKSIFHSKKEKLIPIPHCRIFEQLETFNAAMMLVHNFLDG